MAKSFNMLFAEGRTARRCSRFFVGRIDGEKCSFLNTVCLIMFNLLRMAIVRESADPDAVRGPDALQKRVCIRMISGKVVENTSRRCFSRETNSTRAYQMH